MRESVCVCVRTALRVCMVCACVYVYMCIFTLVIISAYTSKFRKSRLAK